MKVEVTARPLYGQMAYYPRCRNAELVARLTGTKTLTPRAILILKEMGCTIEVHQPTNAWETV